MHPIVAPKPVLDSNHVPYRFGGGWYQARFLAEESRLKLFHLDNAPRLRPGDSFLASITQSSPEEFQLDYILSGTGYRARGGSAGIAGDGDDGRAEMRAWVAGERGY